MSNENYKSFVEKMKIEEHDSEMNQILFNADTMKLESELNEKYLEKINTCKELYEKIKEVTEKEEIETLENGRIVFKSKSKSGKEREFAKNMKLFDSCFDKFVKLDNVHQNKISHLNNFVRFAYEKCIDDNCKNTKTDEELKNCARDCFKYDKINKTVMMTLMNEEYMKYIKGVEMI